jgi:hypothetical protein
VSERYLPPTPERALARYRVAVEESDQAPPLLLGSFSDSAPAKALPIHRLGGSPRDVLDGMAAMVRNDALPPLHWVLFCSETYMATSEDPDVLKTIERGELTARAKIGMDVDEAIIVQFAHSDGSTWAATQRFVRRPALGAVAWQEMIVFGADGDQADSTPGGAISDDLTTIVGRSR